MRIDNYEIVTVKNMALILILSLLVYQTSGIVLNRHANGSVTTSRHGKVLEVDWELASKILNETNSWHWTPWQLPKTVIVNNSILREAECISLNSAENFPNSVFTSEQLRMGGFILYCLLGVYCFTMLAIVCNDFFIPCVEFICEDLKIPEHVAAATFMSVATSTPEFFVNVISTLLSGSDMGIGTIVGSALFNTLGVACVGSVAAISPIVLDPRPVTRDSLIYTFNVIVLMVIVWDSQVMWYEATVLLCLYVLYFIFMFNSTKLFKYYDSMRAKVKQNNEVGSIDKGQVNGGFNSECEKDNNFEIKHSIINEKDFEQNQNLQNEQEEDHSISLWRYPKGKKTLTQVWWLYSWVLRFILTFSIPSPKRYRRFYPLAFILCICWIGFNSFLVSWSVTIVGNTFLIPDSIMGMTFLAFGSCLPEACSIFIMSRRAKGSIGVSNALGANSLAILFSLGVPWFIKCMIEFAIGNESKVSINSTGLDWIIGSIPFAVLSLWTVLKLTKFTLKKTTGLVLSMFYVTFLTYAILVETGVIVIASLPLCG